MSASDPLGSSFFRYRKRKQISADGHTPGLDYQTRHRGHTHAPPTGHATQHNHGGDYLAGKTRPNTTQGGRSTRPLGRTIMDYRPGTGCRLNRLRRCALPPVLCLRRSRLKIRLRGFVR